MSNSRLVLDIRPSLCQKRTQNNHYVKLAAGFRYNEIIMSQTALSREAPTSATQPCSSCAVLGIVGVHASPQPTLHPGYA